MSTRKQRPSALFCATLATAAVLFLAAPCLGEEPVLDACRVRPECAAVHERAVKLFDQNDYARALIAFQSAYQLSNAPYLLINIGRCFHRLGRPAEAVGYYERYRQQVSAPSADEAALLDRYLTEARAVLTAERAVAPPAPPPPPALYRRPWLWTIVGLAAAGVALGTGLGVELSGPPRVTASHECCSH